MIQSSFTWDSRGQMLTDDGAMRTGYEAANAPVFALIGLNLGQGMVGGPMPGVRERYTLAAELLNRVLRGERADWIRVQTAVPHSLMAYDWRPLEKWGVKENLLAPHSLVEFRSPPVWKWPGSLLAFLVHTRVAAGCCAVATTFPPKTPEVALPQ